VSCCNIKFEFTYNYAWLYFGFTKPVDVKFWLDILLIVYVFPAFFVFVKQDNTIYNLASGEELLTTFTIDPLVPAEADIEY